MDNYQIPSYPQPDPSWSYAGIWSEIWEMKAEIEKAIKYMGTAEDPNNESDHLLREHLEQIQLRLNSAIALLNNKGLPY